MADVDVEFDFENDLNTDVGQPAEAAVLDASKRKKKLPPGKLQNCAL